MFIREKNAANLTFWYGFLFLLASNSPPCCAQNASKGKAAIVFGAQGIDELNGRRKLWILNFQTNRRISSERPGNLLKGSFQK